jgi:hypothetical protein
MILWWVRVFNELEVQANRRVPSFMYHVESSC